MQLAFFQDDKKISSYNNKDLKREIKDLLLSNPRIKKSYEMGILKMHITLIYADEYINLYKGKRKINSI